MKMINIDQTDLDACVTQAQRERVVIIRDGKPVAVILGMDEEQSQLGGNSKFWELIAERRSQKTHTREQLEKKFSSS